MITRSESIGELMKALAAFQSKIGPIERAIENKFLKTKYADLATILEAVDEPLREAGLVVTQHPVETGAVETMLYHLDSSEWMASTLKLEAKSPVPQDVVGAVTYAKRCALTGILRLRLDRDDDGNAASGKERQKPSAAEKSRKAADKAADTKPYKEIVDEINGLKQKLADVEPERGAAAKFVHSQKVALGLMTGDDLANNMEAGRTLVKNLTHQLDAWKEMEAMGASSDDIVPGLTVKDFSTDEYPLIAEWVHKGKKAPIGEFLAKWEGTREDALEAALAWKGL